MVLLLLLAGLPRRPRRITGAAISVAGLIVLVLGAWRGPGLLIDGGILLLIGLLVLASLRVDPDRLRARLRARMRALCSR